MRLDAMRLLMQRCAVSVLLAGVALWSGCADPGRLTEPIVENPKPTELAITPEHLSDDATVEVLSEPAWEPVTYHLTLANDTLHPWGRREERCYLRVDTAGGRSVGLRLVLLPKVSDPQDTFQLPLRRIVLELDSLRAPRYNEERKYVRGEAIVVLRVPDGGRVVEQAYPVDTSAEFVPAEYRLQVVCKVKLIFSRDKKEGKSQLVLQVRLVHWIKGDGRRKIRIAAECDVNLPLRRG